MVQDMTIEFPLRHYHIADATGLTSVHVSRTLSDFRRSGLIAINDRRLTVLDIEKLHRRANLPLPRMSAFEGKADIKSSRADVC